MKFIIKIKLYEPLYVLVVWVMLFVFVFFIAISNIVEVVFGKSVGS